MINTPQRKRLHTTISQRAYDFLEDIRVGEGFTSISQAIEHLVMSQTFEKKIDALIKAIEKSHVHKQHTPDKKVRVVNDTQYKKPF